jgi:hypothetical protein
MSQAEARAWWAEVEHLREPLEQRRAEQDSRTPGTGRRSVTIRGHAVPGAPARSLRVVDEHTPASGLPSTSPRRRPAKRPIDRLGAAPDRLAAYAVIATLLVVFIAAVTAH